MLEDLLPQDYSLIFKDSAVILDGIPYYIYNFDGSMAECLNIGSQDFVYKDFSNITSVKIPNTGFFNYRGVCVYLSRMPCRRYKHGLHRDNISVVALEIEDNGDLLRAKLRGAYECVVGLNSKSHYNTYMNIYPTLEEALNLLQDQGCVIAFDRQFAVDKEGSIYYKSNKVGAVTKTGGISFLKKFQYLKAALPKGLK